MKSYVNFLENEEPKQFDSEQFKKDISELIDKFIFGLKKELLNTSYTNDVKKGWFDRAKTWLTNIWHGKDNQQNPYYWQNKLGPNLGAKTESLSLEEYGFLKKSFDNLDLKLNSLNEDEQLPQGAEKLRITKIIDDWGKTFKDGLLRIISMMEIKPPQQFNPKTTQQGINTPAIAPDLAKSMEYEDSIDPSDAQGKSWNELSIFDKKRWNKIGGGVVKAKTRIEQDDIGNELPYILRLGDPRIKTLRTFHLRLHNKLERMGRIETHSNPIENKEDLNNRINKIRQLMDQDQETNKFDLAQKIDSEKDKIAGPIVKNDEEIKTLEQELEKHSNSPGYLAAKSAFDAGNYRTAQRFIESKKRKASRGRPPKGQEFSYTPPEGSEEEAIDKKLQELDLSSDDYKKMLKLLASGQKDKVKQKIERIEKEPSLDLNPDELKSKEDDWVPFECTINEKIRSYKNKLLFN